VGQHLLLSRGKREEHTCSFTIGAMPYDFMRESRSTVQNDMVWMLVEIRVRVNTILLSLCSIARHPLKMEDGIFFPAIGVSMPSSASPVHFLKEANITHHFSHLPKQF